MKFFLKKLLIPPVLHISKLFYNFTQNTYVVVDKKVRIFLVFDFCKKSLQKWNKTKLARYSLNS